ncbi:MAG: hypothetical protein COT81_00685 [Candidatus Buchananbacteria bacterium CG10_big_fil_rev_8_21_14_0_10_42_9]|uniref:Uncharacterized protein n=1 Tax=Candidatus Buchananbacteria bacterium CG10_big_fil_rev_8_21_14_0_10_42_9 TaxID=1974526 RepID=A0A2H0W2F3_9BACT|nr:MAG: hypothetical protein COT81_00685 [Candidatus Buchananbacteria bacterium CG10_big_fil_rev_8_21_14_0_10_42_9]
MSDLLYKIPEGWRGFGDEVRRQVAELVKASKRARKEVVTGEDLIGRKPCPDYADMEYPDFVKEVAVSTICRFRNITADEIPSDVISSIVRYVCSQTGGRWMREPRSAKISPPPADP